MLEPPRTDPSIQTLDRVLARMTELIEQARHDHDRLGYFAALYRNVTLSARQALQSGAFTNPERAEQLTIRFACRYLDALDAYRAGQPHSQAWALAFDASKQYWPLVVQHLLLAIHAHINLDLGIAAAQTAPGAAIRTIRADFDKVNQILSDMIDAVQWQLSGVYPLLYKFDTLGGRVDEWLTAYTVMHARHHAWHFAEQLAQLTTTDQAPLIAQRDRLVTQWGKWILNSRMSTNLIFKFIRLTERGSVAEIIDALSLSSENARP